MATRRRDAAASGATPAGMTAPLHSIADQYVAPASMPLTTALIFVPLLVAVAFPLAGALHNTDQEASKEHTFDRMFKLVGSLLALPPLLLRLVATQSLPSPQSVHRSSILSSHSASLLVQVAAQAVRMVLYVVHNWTIKHGVWVWVSGGHTNHVMADHVVLGLAVGASLACELAACVLAAETLLKSKPQRLTMPLALFLAGGLYAWLMLVADAANMYYTARYFHIVLHTMCAVFVALPLFWYPATLLVYKHCVPFVLPSDL